ncbi:hypothetical protein VNI00_008116 [Paramarasmius palmivorus]|uniref:C2H2-type domain-containing protein n=1 Tax=Paramarasmius palmivorus TaxID=297713 RepID=A0AAW0CV47_9AGAR
MTTLVDISKGICVSHLQKTIITVLGGICTVIAGCMGIRDTNPGITAFSVISGLTTVWAALPDSSKVLLYRNIRRVGRRVFMLPSNSGDVELGVLGREGLSTPSTSEELVPDNQSTPSPASSLGPEAHIKDETARASDPNTQPILPAETNRDENATNLRVLNTVFTSWATRIDAGLRNRRDGRYHCGLSGCGESYTSIHDLYNHKRSHEGVEPFVCGYCGIGYRSGSDLRRHLTRSKGLCAQQHQAELSKKS